MSHEQHAIMTFEQIPSEVQCIIFSYFDMKYLAINIRNVNKKWREFVDSDQFLIPRIEEQRKELLILFDQIEAIKRNGDDDSEYWHKIQKLESTIANVIYLTAQSGYLPLLWKKTVESDDEQIKEKKLQFNERLRDCVLRSSQFYVYNGFKDNIIGKNLQGAYLANSYILIADCTDWNLKNANLDNSCISISSGIFRRGSIDLDSLKNTIFIYSIPAIKALFNVSGAYTKKINWQDANAVPEELKNRQYQVTAYNADLPCNFKDKNISGENLRYFRYGAAKAEDILEAGCIMDIEIDESKYTQEELKRIKLKMINDYRIFFCHSNDVNQVLDTLINLINKKNHLLKYKNDRLKNPFDRYGFTNSYANVVNYGRRRLAELAKTPEFVVPSNNDELYKKFQQVFLTDIYGWKERFWASENDNAKEVLQNILEPGKEKLDYHFNKLGN